MREQRDKQVRKRPLLPRIIGPVFLKSGAGLLALATAAACTWLAAWSHRTAPAPPSRPALPLQGRVVVIDPGHGGIDGGTHDGSGLLEKEINLAVARHLHRSLAQRGATVFLTRYEDTDLSHLETTPRTRQGRDLLARARLAHRYGAEAFISLHVNFSRNHRERGGIAFYQRHSPESRLLAALIQEELKLVQPENRQTILQGNFFLLRHAPEPAVLVEVGFLSHPVERRLLREPEYRRLLAEAIGRGVERYFLSREGGLP